MRWLRRLLLSREERAYLKAFDRAEPVEVTGRSGVVVTIDPPQGTWATTGAGLPQNYPAHFDRD